jgi:hypothetical protein
MRTEDNTMRATRLLIIAAVASQVGAGDCGGGILRDPGFDLWCGDSLCAWKLERGEVRRAATWHESDAGVELVETDTAIEQFAAVEGHDRKCISFDMVTDVAETAQVDVGIDVFGDGTIERSFAVPTLHWRQFSFRFAVDGPFTGIRFELAKHGAGRAVLARIHATEVTEAGGCDGIEAISGGPAPLGALCDGAGDCASALCATINFFENRCAACDPDHASCGTGQVCGFAEPGPPERTVPITCVPAAARELGEQCVRDGECAGGVCELGVCSACRVDADCAGASCAPAYVEGPRLCAPGQRTGKPGASCVSPGDCASGLCNGAERTQCPDGRSCATDANCPVDFTLVPGACVTVGIQGGTCS